MKKTLLLTALALPSFAFATFQMAAENNMPPHRAMSNTLPQNYRAKHAYTLTLRKGELAPQLKTYLGEHHYTLNWQAKKSTPILNYSRIKGSSMREVLNSLFVHYPYLKLSIDSKKKVVTVKS